MKQLRGFKDVYQQWPTFQHVIDRSKPVLEGTYGFKRLLQNVVEREQVFSRTLGSDSDIVQKEMYRFKDLGKNELVLRPEGTAGAMRFVLGEPELLHQIEKDPLRMWYWGPMFRYERPQAGRLRQFYQLGVEMVGGASDSGSVVLKDYEAITSACDILDLIFEHRVNFTVNVNNLGSRESIKLYNAELLQVLK